MTKIDDVTKTILELAEYAKEQPPTGDAWLDDMYVNGGKPFGVPPLPYYKFLYLLSRSQGTRFAVELGTWRGFAASHICAGSPLSTVLTIDIHREDKAAQAYVQNAVVPHFGGRLVYVNAWSWDAVPVVKAWGRPIDLLYIDAWHEYQYVKREWDLYTPLMNEESIIVCDDLFDAAGATEGMLRFWNEVEQPKFMLPGLHEWIPQGVVLWNW